MGKVYKLNGVWHYSVDPDEVAKSAFDDSDEFDEVLLADISDWHVSHVCVLRLNGKLGIYNLHHFRRTVAYDLDTWCSPTV